MFHQVQPRQGKAGYGSVRAPEGKHEISGFIVYFLPEQVGQHVWTKAIVEDRRLADNVTVNIVCPGGVETNNEVIHL